MIESWSVILSGIHKNCIYFSSALQNIDAEHPFLNVLDDLRLKLPFPIVLLLMDFRVDFRFYRQRLQVIQKIVVSLLLSKSLSNQLGLF